MRHGVDVLDLRNDHCPVVVAGDGSATAGRIPARAHAEAARAGRRIIRSPHDCPGLIGGVHVRDDDPRRPSIERLRNQDRLVVRDPDDAGAQVAGGLNDALHGGEVDEAVLHVHEQPVEPGRGDDFRQFRRRQRQQRAEQWLATGEAVAERVVRLGLVMLFGICRLFRIESA